MIGFFILLKNRKRLNEHDFKCKFGFIYLGLKDYAFYWEIMLHFRKILIISINVFFTTFVSLYRVSSYQINYMIGLDWIHVNDYIY